MVFQNQILAGASGAKDYTIDQSCRFNDDDTPYMHRTPGSGGNTSTWTLSVWLKRGSDVGSTSTQEAWFGAGDGGGDTGPGDARYDHVGFYNDKIQFSTFNGFGANLQSNAVFRDPSAWYHVVLRYDDTQSTAADRVRLYVNGVAHGWTTTNFPDEDKGSSFNAAYLQRIGTTTVATNRGMDGYMAEMVMIDGTSLGPESFGETNSDTGQWVAKAITGLTFGTNGFHMKFQNSSALGDDSSGNNNDYATSGLAASDQMADTPTNNQITFNLLNNQQGGGTLTNGNLVYNGPSTRTLISLTANIPPTGKWAVAFTASVISTNAGWNFGITKDTNSNFGDAVGSNEDVGASDGLTMSPSSSDLQLYDYITSTSIDPTLPITTSDEFWLAVDMATGKCFLGISNQSDSYAMIWVAADAGVDGNPATGANPTATITAMIGSTDYTFAAAGSKGNADLTLLKSADLNGTIPSGYTYFENTSDFPDPTIVDPSAYFQPTLYTGDGAVTLAVNQSGNNTFEPDFVWIKNDDATDAHCLFDSVRGVTKLISSDSTAIESTDADTLKTFDSDGFSVGADVKVNTSGEEYISWQWLGANGTATNETGDITSTVCVNTTSGFSVLTYTGNGSASQTIGHGLGAVPQWIFSKRLDAVGNWSVYNSTVGINKYMILDLSNAVAANTEHYTATPTTSVYTIGVGGDINTNTGTFVAYCFTEIDGYSKFGSYTGNNSANGTYVNCGFTPAFIIIKRTDSTGDWPMKGTTRSPDNEAHETLYANTTAANFGMGFDILSNGFKMKTTDPTINASGGTYVYAAWAQTPFKSALAR